MKRGYIIALNIGYWLFMWMLITILYIASQINADNGPNILNLITLMGSFILVPSVISFYGSYFILFQNFVAKAGAPKLILLSIGLTILSSLVGLLSVYSSLITTQAMVELGVISFLWSSFNALIGFILRSFISWFTDLKVKEELTRKTVMLELEMVKLKLDPHFLFNTINNIDVLIETDPEKASEYILKLSSILRFYLYKTSDSRIKLTEEIKYIHEYVDLQKIRTSNKNFVHLTIEGNPNGKEISPMIFIPFIENAFKHSTNKKLDTIEIHFDIKTNEILFQCKNNWSKPGPEKTTGVGNKMITNRLNLIYENAYSLNTKVSEEHYIVDLKIPV